MTTSDPVGQSELPTRSERISVPMLEEHLAQVLLAWFGEHDLPPEEPVELDPYIENMRLGLVQDGDLGAFQIGVRTLLDTPGLDLSRFNAGQSDYDDDEMRGVLEHILARLLGRVDSPSASRVAAVLDWNEGAEDWWVRRGILHRIRTGDTLRSIATEYRIALPTLLDRNPYYRRRYSPDEALSVAERVVRLGAR